MKKILLPTDFSENAWNAIEYVLAIFKDQTCQFYILNAYQIGSSGLMSKMGQANKTRLFQITKEESERVLSKTLERIKTIPGADRHGYIPCSICDDLIDAIGKTTYEEGIDIIVMGTKGSSGLKEVFIGSNTYKIIKKINFCPVIAVPDDFKYSGDSNTLLFVTGYEHLYESYEFLPMIRIANMTNATISVLYVGDSKELKKSQKTAKNLISKYLKSLKHNFLEDQESDSINEAIQNVVSLNKQVTMVMMLNYWHSFFEKITHEPVIKKVVFNTKVPFLVMHLFE